MQLLPKSGGHWSCATFMPFLLLVGWCWQSYFCFLKAQGQHISTTVYKVCWLQARRISGPQAPLSLSYPDGPFICTSWEALTPSQFLKGTLSEQQGQQGIQQWVGSNSYKPFSCTWFSIIYALLFIIWHQMILSTLMPHFVKLKPLSKIIQR